MRSMRALHQRWIFATLLIVALLIGSYLHLSGLYTFGDFRAWIIAFSKDLSPTAYLFFYFIVALLGPSTVVLTVIAGSLFNLWTAYALVVTAATMAAAVAFLIGRYFSDRFTSLLTNQRINKWYESISRSAEKNGFWSIFLLRLLFAPYIPVSYAAGLVKGLSFYSFILATFLVNLIGSYFFLFLGQSLTGSWDTILIAVVLVLLFMQTPKIIRKYFPQFVKSTNKQN